MRLLGFLALIPMTMLLTVSYFVLFANSKVESMGLKKFGMVIAVLLWLAALVVLSGGIIALATGRHPLMWHKQWTCPSCQTVPAPTAPPQKP